MDTQREPVQLVVCDLSTSPYVDLAGARLLTRLCTELAARGAELRLAEAHATVREILRAEGLEERAGAISRHVSVADVIGAFERTRGTEAHEAISRARDAGSADRPETLSR
jgi:MFS superfamily sulfate permease-like transporter